MASTNQSPEPEALFPLEPVRQTAGLGEPRITANVVRLKPSPKEADEHGLHDTSPLSRRGARHTTTRRNLRGPAAAIPVEGDRYVSLAEAGELFSVSQETLRRRIREGALPAVKGGYNLIRVLLSDVAKLFPPMPTVDPDDYVKW